MARFRECCKPAVYGMPDPCVARMTVATDLNEETIGMKMIVCVADSVSKYE